jgi:hypothetical protein
MLRSRAKASPFCGCRKIFAENDLRQKLARLICQSRREDLIDTSPVQIDDFETPAEQFYGLSGLREMPITSPATVS